MNQMSRITLFCLLVIALLVTSCAAPVSNAPAAGSASGEAAQQRVVTMAQTADVNTLDPNIFATSIAVQTVTHLFDTLVERDPVTMEIVGNLAESWEIPDPTTYIFHLKQGVLFHDGEELTAEDVKFSFDRIMDPEVGSTLTIYHEPFISDVEIIDDYTVQISLLRPYAPWIRRLPTFHIVPKHYVEEVGNEEFGLRPIGSGPYKLVEWAKDDHLTLEGFADYHKGAPPITNVVIQPIPEPATRIAALLAGEVDIVDQLPSDSVSTVEQSGVAHVISTNSNTLMHVLINTFEPPFDSVQVRQALNYAIDWETILETVLNGYGVRSIVPATPFDFAYGEYIDDLAPNAYTYDPERARELLAEAGYPDGFSTTIETSPGATNQAMELSQVIAGQLAEIGITAQVETFAENVLNDRVRNREMKSLALSEVANPLFDPDHVMSVQFDPARTSRYFNTPELTELIAAGLSSTDDAERVEIYREIMTLLLEQAPWIIGYNTVYVYGVSNDIDWTPRADRRVFVHEASFAGE